MIKAITAAGGAVALAREPARDEIDPPEFGANGPDVVSNNCMRPSSGEVLAPPFVGLDKPGVLDPGLGEADVEQSCA